MAYTPSRATTLLHAHPNIPAIVSATTAGVAVTDDSAKALEMGRFLLKRFPAEVRSAAANRERVDYVNRPRLGVINGMFTAQSAATELALNDSQDSC